MNKFRLISKSGDALALLLRIAEEGNSVDFWLKTAKTRPSYRGMLSQVSDWRRGLTRDTVCIFDMVSLGSIAEQLKKAGYKVFGAGKINDALELNREWGMKMAKVSGLRVPEYKRFTSFTKGADFIAEQGGAWVFKPANNASPALTYLSDSPEDMVEMLGYFKSIWTGKVDFILQKRIYGVEVSTECFYVKGEPVPNSLNSTFETKRLMNGDNGPNTGCQSSVVRFWKQSNPKIYRLGLKKMEPLLKRFKYNGPLDCNTIVSETDKMPYFLEWTARLGYSAIYALCEGIGVNVGDMIASLANGSPGASGALLRPSYDWCGAVRVTVPPYPSEHGVSVGIPIRGVDSLEHCWLLDAKFEKGKLTSAGIDGVVAEVSGKADTIERLGKQIYDRIAKLKIPDKQFRTDLVENTNRRLSKLRDWNYF